MDSAEVSASGFAEKRYAAIDGLSLYYREYGVARDDRPAVLCLPGLTRNSRDFNRLGMALRDDYRVIAIDYRGRGRSDYDPNWKNYALSTYVQDVRHLLASLEISSVVAIGTSMGGLLAMELAEAVPDVLRGAVINDIGPEINPTGLLKIVRYMKGDNEVSDWTTAVTRIKKAFPDLPARNDDDWLEIAQGAYREADGRLLPDWDLSILKPLSWTTVLGLNLWKRYRALGTRPVLAVRGGTSRILTSSVHRRMTEALPNARALTIPGVGHAPSLAEPESIEAIRDVLQRA